MKTVGIPIEDGSVMSQTLGTAALSTHLEAIGEKPSAYRFTFVHAWNPLMKREVFRMEAAPKEQA